MIFVSSIDKTKKISPPPNGVQVPSNAAAGEPKVGPGIELWAPGAQFKSPLLPTGVNTTHKYPPPPPPLQWHDQGSARELSSHILSNILNPWIK